MNSAAGGACLHPGTITARPTFSPRRTPITKIAVDPLQPFAVTIEFLTARFTGSTSIVTSTFHPW